MITQTIKDISVHLKMASQNLETFIPQEHKEENFQGEEEYTADFIKDGLKDIFEILNALVDAHDEFVKISTHEERADINVILSEINSHLSLTNYHAVAVNYDELKAIVYRHNFRTASESEEVLKSRISNYNQLSADLHAKAQEIEKIWERAREAAGDIGKVVAKYTEITQLLKKLEEKSNQLSTFFEQSQSLSQGISDLLTNAKSNEGTLSHLADRVGEREIQLDEQQKKTSQYEAHLEEYKKQHDEILEKAKELTELATKALSDAATAGLSGAIHERYVEEKKKSMKNMWWLFGGAAFSSVAGFIGYYMISVDQLNLTLGGAVARIAIMSVAISAAWFCASQYVRYRNTLDDYGYKSVLARSIVAFLDQFKDPQERADYLRTVLHQIHQDPLRKKHDVDTPMGNFLQKVKKDKDVEDDQ